MVEISYDNNRGSYMVMVTVTPRKILFHVMFHNYVVILWGIGVSTRSAKG